MVCRNLSAFADAPRAGSAESKSSLIQHAPNHSRCTPCRQRRGKERDHGQARRRGRMHPVQAASRQREHGHYSRCTMEDAPRAGSAEAKRLRCNGDNCRFGCTPCRQRRGKVWIVMHRVRLIPDAPCAGSAEAKLESLPLHVAGRGCTPCRNRKAK